MKWTFDRVARSLTHASGTLEGGDYAGWTCPAHGDAVPMPQGPLPAGTYTLGPVEWNEPEETADVRSMGPCFIPLLGIPGHSGIGIHGGGSAAAHPLAAQQGWFPTENCIRLQNADLYHVAQNVTAGDTIVVV